MSSITTKRGDAGLTDLLNGQRESKASFRVCAYGTLDELNSVLGLARAHLADSGQRVEVLVVQKRLQEMMAVVAGGNDDWFAVTAVEEIEQSLTIMRDELPELDEFIVPGDNVPAAFFDQARTVARRAERELWDLSGRMEVPRIIMMYLNRLSDWCFQQERKQLIDENLHGKISDKTTMKS